MGPFNFDPNDPHKLGLMMAAAQLLGARGNTGQALGQGLMGYVGGRMQGQDRQGQRAEEAQRRELRQMELSRTRGLLDRESRIDALGPQFMRPGAAPSLTPGDDEGYPMPSTAPSMDWSGYQNALSGIDPRQGLALQAQLAQI